MHTSVNRLNRRERLFTWKASRGWGVNSQMKRLPSRQAAVRLRPASQKATAHAGSPVCRLRTRCSCPSCAPGATGAAAACRSNIEQSDNAKSGVNGSVQLMRQDFDGDLSIAKRGGTAQHSTALQVCIGESGSSG